jgi:hypothetical protein
VSATRVELLSLLPIALASFGWLGSRRSLGSRGSLGLATAPEGRGDNAGIGRDARVSPCLLNAAPGNRTSRLTVIAFDLEGVSRKAA